MVNITHIDVNILKQVTYYIEYENVWSDLMSVTDSHPRIFSLSTKFFLTKFFKNDIFITFSINLFDIAISNFFHVVKVLPMVYGRPLKVIVTTFVCFFPDNVQRCKKVKKIH